VAFLDTTFEWFVVFLVREAFLKGVVAGDDDLLRADLRECSSFNLGLKRISVHPAFEEVSHVFTFLGVGFFNDNNIFAVIAVPPFVDLLVVMYRVLGPDLVRFARTGRTIPPLEVGLQIVVE